MNISVQRHRQFNATIAVVDAGGHLIALERMDGALLAGLESAQVKARTSLFFGAATRFLPGTNHSHPPSWVQSVTRWPWFPAACRSGPMAKSLAQSVWVEEPVNRMTPWPRRNRHKPMRAERNGANMRSGDQKSPGLEHLEVSSECRDECPIRRLEP